MIGSIIQPPDLTSSHTLANPFVKIRATLGSVGVSAQAALLRKISPGQAWDAGNGCSLAKTHNNAWRNFTRNPKGRACFSAMRRFSMLIWNNQTPPLMPCLALKQAPARLC
ncbi:MAG TPA: hypothetical protein VN303_04035 [Pseudomonas sp.]|nr:hypothetical protein [Pseudomonas sp.]